MWYSFNYGPAHFISLNTETDLSGANEEHEGASGIEWLRAGGFAADGAYMKWLRGDLAKAASERASGLRPWIIVGGHRPLWSEHDKTIFYLLLEHRVDFIFAGHLHAYAYSRPAFGTDLVMVGGAGCDEKESPSTDEDYVKLLGNGVVFSDRLSSGILDVSRERIRWRLIDSIDGSILHVVERIAEQPL